ncbi:eukaryotic cytochrome b561-domain-containing protein [Massariosphaeria phaeospora]|uniref:Eukaryotic cytochrome b561-domain-containing protein n=1 Tax=Massariosphaeria phaeospora TaxID=100035 RepID=A0A7C8IF18_9PLEO|nr:eukaryotic cytochrome b561-domain-containing protein [Massariosphaeria phaeospora]
MASATGVPEHVHGGRGTSEEEPLLGLRGDASQKEGTPLYLNLWLGTAPIAQAGIWILAAIVWGAILSHKLIFFSAHPLLNSAGLLLATQAALILQPTHTPSQKRAGTLAHATLHLIALLSLISGLIVIELNKAGPGHEHFASPHAILGLLFYILIVLQALVGFTQYFTPGLYGGVDKAKRVYKWHRAAGYVISTLGLATVCAASWTTYSLGVAHLQHWAVVLASVLVVVGLVPRVRLSKFGLRG